MVLNIFPRRTPATTQEQPEIEQALPEPSPEALAEPAPILSIEDELTEDGEAKKRPTRRGTRGGRGRKRPADGTEESAEATAEADSGEDAEPAAPAPAPRRTSRRAAAAAPADAEVDGATAEAPARPSRRTAARAPRTEEPQTDEAAPAARPSRPLRVPVGTSPDTVTILRAVEQQSRLIEQLMRNQEELARRGGSGAAVGAPPARVGIFVDTANVELACDRLRVRFDWAKILAMLTKDRQLIRAIAYAPVHDDPNVSPETQRFAEPFLGKGYKVVTKPLKRFADGSVKANVDIELALDVIEMADRLDVVCLVSGDGDFVRLVEVLQGKGIRVEVISVGSSTAGNLRLAADEFIDLQSRVRDLRA